MSTIATIAPYEMLPKVMTEEQVQSITVSGDHSNDQMVAVLKEWGGQLVVQYNHLGFMMVTQEIAVYRRTATRFLKRTRYVQTARILVDDDEVKAGVLFEALTRTPII